METISCYTISKLRGGTHGIRSTMHKTSHKETALASTLIWDAVIQS